MKKCKVCSKKLRKDKLKLIDIMIEKNQMLMKDEIDNLYNQMKNDIKQYKTICLDEYDDNVKIIEEKYQSIINNDLNNILKCKNSKGMDNIMNKYLVEVFKDDILSHNNNQSLFLSEESDCSWQSEKEK